MVCFGLILHFSRSRLFLGSFLGFLPDVKSDENQVWKINDVSVLADPEPSSC